MSEQAARQRGFLLTGASGMVGRALAQAITGRHLRLIQAVRGPAPPSGAGGPQAVQARWNPLAPTPFADPGLLEGLDVAIHLSGANLAAHRWTAAYKKEIVSSRTVSTAAIARTLASLAHPPRLLITASATGIYGDRGDEILTETSPPGRDFLSETCLAWEAATASAITPANGMRVVHLRLGVVLDPEGGALAKVLPLFRAGLGGRLGNGRQWMSWIAIDDLVRAVMHIAGYGADPAPDQSALDTQSADPAAPDPLLEGPVNCISPFPVTNAAYTRALAAVLHRPALAAAPAFALRLALGEMADQALLASCRALPARLTASGFRFRFPEIGAALEHLLAR